MASGVSDRDYMLNAIRDHGMICIYRRTGGTYRLANELAVEGLVEIEIVQVDEQSSYAKVTLAGSET